MINETAQGCTAEMRRAAELLYEPGAVVELRAIKKGKGTVVGFFDDRAKLVRAGEIQNNAGREVYINLNEIDKDLRARACNRTEPSMSAVSDGDVKRLRHILVDVDPVRPSGISSSDEEKAKGESVALAVRDHLNGLGIKTIFCDSGNGYHLLVPVDIETPDKAARDEAATLVKRFLEALAFLFDTDGAKVDTGTHNTSRITKFYGVVSRKGDSVPERPHRRSEIISAPSERNPAPRELLEEVAAGLPDDGDEPQGGHSQGFKIKPDGFDSQEWLTEWIAKHGVSVKRHGPWNGGGYRWILDTCPNGHTDNSAFIVVWPDGGFGGGCKHNSCKHLGWRGIREHYEPGAYDEARSTEDKFGGYAKNGSKHASSASSASSASKPAALPDPMSFPLHVLPPTVRRFVREAAESIGCPVDFVAVPTLGTLSAGIGNTRRLRIKKSWTEGAAVYLVTIANSGSKKTPAIAIAVRPIRDKQMDLKADYDEAMRRYKSELRDFKGTKKDGPTSLTEPEKPMLKRTYVDDTTVERLGGLMGENERGLALVSDELTGWVSSLNQYKQGKGGDRQFYLAVFSNSTVTVDRKNLEEPIIVPRPWLTIIGGVQPSVLSDFGHDRGDGLFDRFLTTYPATYRSRWTDADLSDETYESYANTVHGLYGLRRAIGDDERPRPLVIDMTPDAKALFVETYNDLQEELEEPGFPDRLRPVWSKLEGYLARLSLILATTRMVELRTLGQDIVIERVIREDVAGAITLLAYFKNHAQRVFAHLYGQSPTDRLTADLIEFLESVGGQWEGVAEALHGDLDSEFKPERPEDLSKAVRAIAKRTPTLTFETLKRVKDRRPFRLTLGIHDPTDTTGSAGSAGKAGFAGSAGNTETPSADAGPHEDEPKDEGGSPYASVNPDVRVAFEKPSQDLRARLREYQMGQMSQTRLCALVSEIIFGNPTRLGDVKPAVKVWLANEERF